ncbi:isopentenyl-diphosphate Delta-isomerase [Longispora albida]|uniref:isopentenyl-diphosphate Delta-isomerase n=1 Tax=Longispora albida TaxID=203523 RepID=UPI000366C934|nr:isopentenyl-diphosphate Delta-isomerase [Longispora albida]
MSGEQVVLVDETGHAIGTEDKLTAHHGSTPLHLAFSCYLVDEAGQVLITRRAPSKRTFPAVWTNSCCGHPGPGEGLAAAVARRVRQELGAELTSLTLVLPQFRYRAVAADGTVENELCPVLRGRITGELAPDPSEVDGTAWWTWSRCLDYASTGADASPWFRMQVTELAKLGAPVSWPAADPGSLPPGLHM